MSVWLAWLVFSAIKSLSLLQAAESKLIDFGLGPNVHILFSLAYTVYQPEPHIYIVTEISNSMFSAICLCECVSTELTLKEIYTSEPWIYLTVLKHVCVRCACL